MTLRDIPIKIPIFFYHFYLLVTLYFIVKAAVLGSLLFFFVTAFLSPLFFSEPAIFFFPITVVLRGPPVGRPSFS